MGPMAALLYHYPGNYRVWRDLFAVGLDAADPMTGSYFCYDKACLDEWAKGTNYYSDMNGQLTALQMWSDMSQDFSPVAKLIHDKFTFPIFVYGGRISLNPVASMIWTYDAMHNEQRLGDQFLLMEAPGGVHVPWLGQNPSRDQFYGNLTAWLQALPSSPTSSGSGSSGNQSGSLMVRGWIL